MKNKFNFRFQTILDIKERLEDTKKTQLGTATQFYQEETNRLQTYIEKKNTVNEEFSELTQKVITIKELQNFGSRQEFMQRQIENQNLVVKNCENHMNNCRLELVEAKKQTMIFDKLKEKAQEQFKQMLLKEEELFVDQIVSYRNASK